MPLFLKHRLTLALSHWERARVRETRKMNKQIIKIRKAIASYTPSLRSSFLVAASEL
jgi:hypothetical protein